jgi:hypothetical protein
MRTISSAYLVEAAAAPVRRASLVEIYGDKVLAVGDAVPGRMEPLFVLPRLSTRMIMGVPCDQAPSAP